VDRFLGELGRRLDFLESYGQLQYDAGIEKAYSTLHAVRESCARVSDEMMDAGRHRTQVLLETLEERYKGALATRETFEQKVQSGIQLMEGILADFETRGYAMREYGSHAAHGILEEGRRRMDVSLERAKGVMDESLEKARRAKQTMRDTIDQALVQARERGLITYEDLPEPWKINQYIIRGYRFHDGKLDCVRSALMPSNELVNIWSHALGIVVILTVAFYYYPTSYNFSLSSKSDVFMAGMFFAAAVKCLSCSAIYHTMNCIAHQTLMERFACVDYTGISFLISASIMTSQCKLTPPAVSRRRAEWLTRGVGAAFYCEPYSRWFYLLTTAALGIAGVILPWRPIFNRADMPWLRVGFFVSLSCCGFLPALQLAVHRGPAWVFYFYSPVFKSLLVYLLGAIMYAAKVPERWFPGVFDYVGGSHNLWHIAVVGGILFHYTAMQGFFSEAFARAERQCSIY
jgi:adiponectin receptor